MTLDECFADRRICWKYDTNSQNILSPLHFSDNLKCLALPFPSLKSLARLSRDTVKPAKHQTRLRKSKNAHLLSAANTLYDNLTSNNFSSV